VGTSRPALAGEALYPFLLGSGSAIQRSSWFLVNAKPDNDFSCLQLLPLADPLLALVKGGLVKAAQRLEGLYSLLLLCRLTTLEATLGACPSSLKLADHWRSKAFNREVF
jgi:hypothetical protein